MKTSNLKLNLATSLMTILCAFGLHAADLTWDSDTATTGAQDGAGNWTSAGGNINWWDGGANVTWNNATPDNATFGAGGAAGIVTVPSSTTNTVGNIIFNTLGSGGYNIAAGSSTTSKLILSGNPTITVASGVFATNLVVLSGTSFTKLGAGTFVLKPGAANINSGPTVVGNGTLVIGTSAGRLVIPGNLTITNGATAVLVANEQIADSGTLTLDNGTFDMGSRAETISSLVLDNNGQVISSSSSAILTSPSGFDVRSGTIVAALAGAGMLTKTTGGTMALTNGGNNTYTGGTLISAGILDVAHSGTGNGIPAGTVLITNTGTLRIQKDNQINAGATVNVAGGTFELLAHNESFGNVILANGGSILNGGSTSKTLTIASSMDFRNGLCSSVLGGAGLMVKSTTGTVTLTLDNTYSGGTLISDGILQLGDGSGVNRGQFGTGPVTNNAVIILNHSGTFNLANTISGTGSLTNLGGSPSFTATAGNSYSGGTVVMGGTLFAKNTSGSATGSGAVTVQSGATLAGNGIVDGVVNIQSGGNLAPGNNAIGTLTINGNLTLTGSSTSTFQVNGTTPANDTVALGSSVTYGGALNITPSGTFTAGQQFTLFSGVGAANAGNFNSIVGSPGTDLAFTFTNGVLSVISTASSNPVLNVSQSGSTLTFIWPEAGYKLQSQTNSLSTGFGTNWSDYPGGDTSPVGVTINPANPSVFFRLAPQ